MTEIKVAERYAKALLIYSKEYNNTDLVMNDMEFIQNILNSSKEFALFIQNPILRPNKKIAILNEILKNKISDTTLAFIELLVHKNREAVLKLLVDSFRELYYEFKNKIHVDIISAQELSDELKSNIFSRIKVLTDKEILPHYNIDSSIIGGFQIKFADYFYDASIRKHLENMKNELSK